MGKRKSDQAIFTTLAVSATLNFLCGIGCCVAGVVKWDRRTDLAFKHSGQPDTFLITTYKSDISLVFALAAINLLGTAWPLVCVGNKLFGKGKVWNFYMNQIKSHNVNPMRWIEFCLSVPLTVMVCAIAVGATDFMFLLSQMSLTVAIVSLTYGQEREKFSDHESLLPWMPLSSTVGLSCCQWALIFWCAYESKEFRKSTHEYGWLVIVAYFIGSWSMLYALTRSSKYFVRLFTGSERYTFTNTTTEIVEEIISCGTRVLVTLACLPLLHFL
jgi:ABC-type uncharacterized transport system permease subunit